MRDDAAMPMIAPDIAAMSAAYSTLRHIPTRLRCCFAAMFYADMPR